MSHGMHSSMGIFMSNTYKNTIACVIEITIIYNTTSLHLMELGSNFV